MEIFSEHIRLNGTNNDNEIEKDVKEKVQQKKNSSLN